MKFPFLASMLIFLLVLHYNLNKGKRLGKKQEDSFWKKEYEANTTRKKSLSDLTYITFQAEDFFPINLLEQHQVSEFLNTYPDVKKILPRFIALSNEKIVNLSRFTNTELKFEYGIANFNLLSEYDENYLELISLLNKYGSVYYDAGYLSQALAIFEYAISIGSDVTDTFLLLADIYKREEASDSLATLYTNVEKLSDKKKNIILKKLKESQ